MANTRRSFGRIEKRPRGLLRVGYVGPDGRTYRAPNYFDTRIDAEGWLHDVKRQIDTGAWVPPDVAAARAEAAQRPAITLSASADDWIEARPLKARTRQHYRTLLNRFILPELGSTALSDISIGPVRAMAAKMGLRARANAPVVTRSVRSPSSTPIRQLAPMSV